LLTSWAKIDESARCWENWDSSFCFCFLPLCSLFFLPFVLCFFSSSFSVFLLFSFGFFSSPIPLESFVFIGNVAGSPSAHDFSLNKHDREGGVGFLLGLGHLRFDPYLHGVVIFMKIRFAIYVLVGLGCQHSTISFPSF